MLGECSCLGANSIDASMLQGAQGVDAAALLQGRRDDEDRELALASAAASAAPEEGGLHAAFKRERQQDEGADNPHM